jgi:hypothetical protein
MNILLPENARNKLLVGKHSKIVNLDFKPTPK